MSASVILAEAAAPERPSAVTAREAVRLASVDVTRGATLAAMLLVNGAGDFGAVYSPLTHADWNGLHFADLVFPFFVFVMGLSIPLAFGPALVRATPRRTLWLRLASRAGMLLGLGLLLNAFPGFDLAHVRIPGVLQRMALAYVVASAVFLVRPSGRAAFVVAAALCATYQAALAFAPAPLAAAGAAPWEANLAAALDRSLFGGHLLYPAWDPEGLLATLPTAASALLGVAAGRWLAAEHDPARRIGGLAVAGALGVLAGALLDPVVPINKSLWSTSFVLVTGGGCALLAAALHAMVDVAGMQRGTKPFRWLGRHSLSVYVGSCLASTTLLAIVVGDAGDAATLHERIFARVFAPLGPPEFASLLHAAAVLALWTLVAAALERRRPPRARIRAVHDGSSGP